MRPIDKDVLKELNSFEVSELTRIMEAVEEREYYKRGYKNLCGAYAKTEITDILFGEDDSDDEKEQDLLEFALESGVNEPDGWRAQGCTLTIPRRIVGNTEMSRSDKLTYVENRGD